MSWKTIVVLLLLALGLGGYFCYDTYWLVPARDKAESVKGRLWSVEAKDVDGLTIKRGNDVIRVKRVEGGWEMLEPLKARGDRGPIDEVITSLTTARVDREVASSPSKLADFGLDPAAAEVKLDVKGRAEPLALLVGGKSPTGAWVYAKEPSKPAVVTLSEVTARDVSRPASDFRDKTIVAFDRKAVTGIDLDVDGQSISLAVDEPGKWRIVKPGAYRADGDMIAEFLDKLETSKAREFAPEAPPAQYGLDKPTRVTIWIGKDKDRSSRTLSFGKVDPAKQGVWVTRGDDAGVMLAPEELWKSVPKNVAVLRDKVVIPYAYDKAHRIEIESARGTVTIERDGSGWKITAPEVLKADTTAVSNLLWKLRDLRATGFLSDGPADVSKLIAKPEVTVRVWEEGAKEPKTLVVRTFTEKPGGGTPAALAAVVGQGPVALVEGKAVEDLSRTATDLRDRAIFPAFDTADVKRLRLVAGDKPLVVDRAGEKEWKVVEPKAGAAKEMKVGDVLLTLKSLRWKDIASPKGDDTAKYGLDKPELAITLAKAGNADIGTLLVGKREGDVTYVRLKDAPAIYAVEDKILGDLRKAPSEIPG